MPPPLPRWVWQVRAWKSPPRATAPQQTASPHLPQSQYVFLHSCLLSKVLEGPSSSSGYEPLQGPLLGGARGLGPIPLTNRPPTPVHSRAAKTGSWGASSGTRAAREAPRPQPIPVGNFAQACTLRAADTNTGFVGEYKVCCWPVGVTTGVPSRQHLWGLPASRALPSQLLLQALKDHVGSATTPPGCEQEHSGDVQVGGTWAGGNQWQPHAPPHPSDDHSVPPAAEEGPPGEMPEAWLFPLRQCPLTVCAPWVGHLGVLGLRWAGDNLSPGG